MEKVGNQTDQGQYKLIVAQSLMLLLRDEVYLVQSTPDAHDRMLCRLFKPLLHTRDTARHRALPVSTNRHTLGVPHWVNHVNNFGEQVELVFCGLVDEQRNFNDMNI